MQVMGLCGEKRDPLENFGWHRAIRWWMRLHCWKPKERPADSGRDRARDLGAQATNRISLELEPFDGRTVAIVRCQPREEPTWLGGELFVRRTASTARLSPQETVAWIHERWH